MPLSRGDRHFALLTLTAYESAEGGDLITDRITGAVSLHRRQL